MPTDSGQHICKRRLGLVVPGSPLHGNLAIGVQRMSQQRHHRVETEQTGRGALDGAIRPLPLRFETKMDPAFLEGRFNAPSLDELLHDRSWPIVRAGREVSSWLQATVGITHEYPSDRQYRLANPIPHRRPAGHVQLPSSAVVPTHAYALPGSVHILEHL